jgi:hypothetical protein
LWELPLSSKPKPGAELVLATKQIQENPRKTKQNRLDLGGEQHARYATKSHGAIAAKHCE